jgi:hypothetical protein
MITPRMQEAIEMYQQFRAMRVNDICETCNVSRRGLLGHITRMELNRNQYHRGYTFDKGYVAVWNPEYAQATGRAKRQIQQHIIVMEQHLGRRLAKGECVHHIDEDRANNDLSNLRLMSNGEHCRLHRIQSAERRGIKPTLYICPWCGAEFTAPRYVPTRKYCSHSCASRARSYQAATAPASADQ